MISIRTLALRHAIGYIVLISILTLVTRWLWFYPQQVQFALKHQEKELVSLQGAIRSVHENLTYLAHHHATSLEIQHWVSNPQLIDIEVGKQELDLVRYELQYYIFADIDNNILLGLYRSNGNTQIKEFSSPLKEMYQERLSKTRSSVIIENFELFNNQPVMAVTYPIFNDDEERTLIGRIVASWKLYGSSLNQIAEIIQLDVQPSTDEEIEKSQKNDLYQDGFEQVAEKHVRCLYDNTGERVNCLTIHHDKQLIPEFFTLRTLARIIAFSLIPLVFFLIMLNYFIRPLEQSTRFLRSTSSTKGITHLTNPAPISELEEMRIAFNELVDATHQQRDQLESQSMTDALTQIPNRRAFDKEIEKVQNRLLRHNGTAAIIICDIDHFKLFNDHYGHQHGDKILRKVAKSLHQFGFRSDEICARYGGEEFAIILSNLRFNELKSVLKKIIKNINKLKEPHAKSPFSRVTITCGAIYINSNLIESGKDSTQQWIESADKALYKAKQLGRNRYEISE